MTFGLTPTYHGGTVGGNRLRSAEPAHWHLRRHGVVGRKLASSFSG
jgi:hypothetical protein